MRVLAESDWADLYALSGWVDDDSVSVVTERGDVASVF